MLLLLLLLLLVVAVACCACLFPPEPVINNMKHYTWKKIAHTVDGHNIQILDNFTPEAPQISNLFCSSKGWDGWDFQEPLTLMKGVMGGGHFFFSIVNHPPSHSPPKNHECTRRDLPCSSSTQFIELQFHHQCMWKSWRMAKGATSTWKHVFCSSQPGCHHLQCATVRTLEWRVEWSYEAKE